MRKIMLNKTKFNQLINTVLAISIIAYSVGILVGSGKIKIFGA